MVLKIKLETNWSKVLKERVQISILFRVFNGIDYITIAQNFDIQLSVHIKLLKILEDLSQFQEAFKKALPLKA